MGRKCIGMIDVIGLAAAIQAADTAVKSGNVELLGYEYSGFDGHITVKIEGKVGAVKAAIAAAKVSVGQVKGSLPDFHLGILEAALDESVYNTLIHNKHTVSDPLQIASGKRPQGTSRQAKWVGHWEQKGCYIRE